ncbi:hypothetical protein WH47_05638 [Habropoda laboriosa]|uniref:Uncharacterized protein n=1 Tax=Habropoda laboriosa TaxID=597456 RepID=A0A0L7QQG8_9HYME|nr:PREDICTED: uncharacterized protein LOC108576363 [Habropoda laboriosa]KOC60860.1 hypothetical protein WH47_05638 [Habropoda laboriosa]
MASIFNLFGEISERDKDSVLKPLSRSKTSLEINNLARKNVGQSKPKGLSIRSNSDLNVPAAVQNSFSKQQENLKPKLTQLDSSGCPVSPRKDLLSKKLNESSNTLKDASLKEIFNKKDVKLSIPSYESIFKKPLPPKKMIKKIYPEPERLAPYHDVQFEFEDIYTKTIENEFKELLMKKRNEEIPYIDEGFESDPECIDFEIPELRTSPKLFYEEQAQCKTPDLPEISDGDNDNHFEE